MNSNTSLSGEDLKNLYTENKLNDHLNNPENLKKLLNYELDCMGDTFDSNDSFEIIDFCVDKLKEIEPIDEQKMNFLGQKIMLEARELDHKMKFRRIRKFTVVAATFGIIIVVAFFGGTKGYAGKFDFIHSLIAQDKGEQLSLETSDSTLDNIEVKEGHLPNSFSEKYSFLKSSKDITSYVSTYNYIFENPKQQKLYILIKDFKNSKSAFKNEIELNTNSLKKETIDEITYYYSCNQNINSISWIYKSCIYKITGSLSFNDLEEILSLYREEQITK